VFGSKVFYSARDVSLCGKKREEIERPTLLFFFVYVVVLGNGMLRRISRMGGRWSLVRSGDLNLVRALLGH
jgi:hypothetical protein